MEEKKHTESAYRIVVFSESTFEEIRSFIYKPWYIWIGALGLLLIILMVALGFIYVRPLNALIVRTQGGVAPEELIDLRQKVLSLESETQAQELYINNLRRFLSGEVIMDSTDYQEPSFDSVEEVSRIEEDEQLRQAMDQAERNPIALPARSHQPQNRTIEQLYLIPPVNGAISLDFNPEINHLGIDINAPSNTPIKSILDGYVIFSGWTLETGNTIGIQHGENLISFYKHNSSLLKKIGSFVKAGEAVAIIGNSGTLSSGPHLHFELWVNGRPVDPARYINFQ